MSILLNGDCLEELKDLDDKSIDLIFCDLPYGQTSCKWDCIIDLDKLWIEFMRIKKLNTPIIMTCTTKFGVSLINSAPKKCPFRYDLIWCKSACAGFLSAKKMPMRKHEMVYFFYEKLPFYDLSSHKHKFIKEKNGTIDGNKIYECKKVLYRNKSGLYSPALPTSLIKEDCPEPEPEPQRKVNSKNSNKGGLYSKIDRLEDIKYSPALPTSLIKEVIVDKEVNNIYGCDNITDDRPSNIRTPAYEPALPTSLLEIKSTRGKHSTEKPVQLMEWILKYYSKENDTILDPTMGSGSMGVACKNMNRNFIGIEKDPEIYEGAVNRLEN
tara:strand:- start:1218 stop:2192 length:975 start_codon:yes stop_codon:yes gene_type:complete